MSTLASAGTGGLAQPGFALTTTRLSEFDFSARASTAEALAASTTSPVSALPPVLGTYAWVQVSVSVLGGNLMNMKYIKNDPYPGCPGGWKLAGWDHVDMHMNAGVSKNNFGGVITYDRRLAVHVGTNEALAEGVGSIKVEGPGLRVYSGNAADPVGAQTLLTLIVPPVPAVGVRQSWLGMEGQFETPGSFYGNSEAIQSCQDLAATNAPAGTPCYDETAVAPGAVFTWTVYDTAATPAVKYAFPFQVSVVPLSSAFVSANEADLFAQNITVVPNGVAALTAAVAGIAVGDPMDDIIKFTYTQSPVYGGRINNCGILLSDSTGTPVLSAEQNAVGQETSCTFNTAGLNYGSLVKPAAMGGGFGLIRVTTIVLGNMAGSSQAFPD